MRYKPINGHQWIRPLDLPELNGEYVFLRHKNGEASCLDPLDGIGNARVMYIFLVMMASAE